MNIGIVGNGYVGKATQCLGGIKNNIFAYDTDPSKCVPQGTVIGDLTRCDIVFICVPTPADKDEGCHTGIVEKVIEDLKYIGVKNIFVRSTVPVGFCQSFGVNFMPEFLTEKNWQQDVRNCNNWIVGLSDPENQDVKDKIKRVLVNAKKEDKIKNVKISYCKTEEAELTKTVINSFLATKVSFFNEIEEFCRKKHINYENVRDLVSQDKRIGYSHTYVPGPDGKRGFGGTCFPKDTASLLTQMIDCGLVSYVLMAARNRNIDLDRPEKDWSKDKGRAVV
tara:strand:- start:2097 stop:2933 length:837 start_codon:yes stop_codon:yes gene_type:complete